MLSNVERALLHTAVVIDKGGDLTTFHVAGDGTITTPRGKGSLADLDDDATIAATYIAATLIKVDGLESAQAIEELEKIAVGRRAAKTAVGKVVHKHDLFSEVLEFVKPLYSANTDAPTELQGTI